MSNIRGSDISVPSIERAKNGMFQFSTIRHIPSTMLEQHFTQASKSMYQLKDPIMQEIDWVAEDIREVLHSDFNQQFDVVMCRHCVFVYFEEELKRELGLLMMKRLKHNGFLIVGKLDIMSEELADSLGLHKISDMVYQHTKKPRMNSNLPIIQVSGFWRSGTSITMEILNRLGIKLIWNEKHEALSQSYGDSWGNDLFYEDFRIMNEGLTDQEGVNAFGTGVKVFNNGYYKQSEFVLDNTFVIVCTREEEALVKSLRKVDWDIYEQMMQKHEVLEKYFRQWNLETLVSHVRGMNLDTIQGGRGTHMIIFEDLIKQPRETIKSLALDLRKTGFEFSDEQLEHAIHAVRVKT